MRPRRVALGCVLLGLAAGPVPASEPAPDPVAAALAEERARLDSIAREAARDGVRAAGPQRLVPGALSGEGALPDFSGSSASGPALAMPEDRRRWLADALAEIEGEGAAGDRSGAGSSGNRLPGPAGSATASGTAGRGEAGATVAPASPRDPTGRRETLSRLVAAEERRTDAGNSARRTEQSSSTPETRREEAARREVDVTPTAGRTGAETAVDPSATAGIVAAGTVDPVRGGIASTILAEEFGPRTTALMLGQDRVGAAREQFIRDPGSARPSAPNPFLASGGTSGGVQLPVLGSPGRGLGESGMDRISAAARPSGDVLGLGSASSPAAPAMPFDLASGLGRDPLPATGQPTPALPETQPVDPLGDRGLPATQQRRRERYFPQLSDF